MLTRRPLVPTGESAVKCDLESPVLQRSASSTHTSLTVAVGICRKATLRRPEALSGRHSSCSPLPVVLVANFAHLRRLRKKLGSREELLVMADAKPSDFNRMLGMGLKLHYREKERQVRPAPLLPTPP